MKTDAEIKNDVLDELAWQPNIDETKIGVIVEDGVVTLNGVVDNYTKKVAAEKAVKTV
ncbi:MAG: BON domain-containing protein [Lutibacter sp.]